MQLNQLRDQLSDLKKKEAVAQSREQLLNEDKKKLLDEIALFLKLVKELDVIPEEEITPNNLTVITSKLQTYIDSEIAKSTIPQELT